MKKTYILIFLFEFSNIIGQNLVNNPSFESYSSCPTFVSQLNRATNWNNPIGAQGTPDYFNSCSTSYLVDVPINDTGTQMPYFGNAYAGVMTYAPDHINYREYLQTQLNAPMVAGLDYNISFFVSMADSPSHASDIGCFFSTTAPNGAILSEFTITPQINTPTPIINYNNWIEVSEVYHSLGGEQFMTIGNFKNDTQINLQFVHNAMPAYYDGIAFYYVDHISVTQANLSVNLFENLEGKIKIFPNPTTSEVNFETLDDMKIDSIELYSTISGLIWRKEFVKNINLENLSSGIYYLVLKSNDKQTIIKKVIKI